VFKVLIGPPNCVPSAYREYAIVLLSGGIQSVIKLYEHGPDTAFKSPKASLNTNNWVKSVANELKYIDKV